MSTAILARFSDKQTRGITHEVMNVSPEMAAKMLLNNPSNRNLRQKDVNKYARDMQRGAWAFNGDPIRFDSNGALIDGQHRLNGVVLAGITVTFLVIRGLPASAQETIDSGITRTVGDSLTMRGEANATILAAIARKALLWDAGLRSFSGGTNFVPSDSEVREYIEENPGLRRAAHVSGRSRKHVPVPASVFGVTYYLCARVDPADASMFFVDKLTDGLGLRPGDPAHALRMRLTLDAGQRGTIPTIDVLGMILRAWNAYRRGETLAKLQAPKGGWTAANLPQPI